jgi:hypothetical protein
MLKTRALIASLLVCLHISSASAQTAGSGDITWLGLDFSQVKFVGPPSQEGGEYITNDAFRDKYTAAWNQLIVTQQKQYNVAGMVHRPNVKYALDITAKANRNIQKNFFGNTDHDFKKLDEKRIGDLVYHYDFQGQTGTGVLIFVEGMSRGMGEAGGWVTMVDMKAKRVLLTTFKTGKAGGLGFRNYWAKSWANILAAAGADFKK